MILSLLEIITVALLMTIWMSQVVLPIVRETPIFPLFRRETKLRGKLLHAEQALVEQELEAELHDKEAKIHQPSKEQTEKCV